MKKVLLIFLMLFTTIAFSQVKTFGTQVKLKKTPNLATVDSLLTKDSNDIISATAFSDFKTQLGLGVYLQNIVEDVTPELGGNLDMNLFDITGIGSINHAGNITSTGTLEIPNIELTNNLTLNNYLNTRDDGTSLNYLFTDASGNLQSGPISNISSGGAINDLSDAIYDGSSLFLGNGSGVVDDGTLNMNVGVGYRSLYSNTTGNENTSVGYNALLNNSIGYGNTAFGAESLKNNTANVNTAFGAWSLTSNTTGIANTSFGDNSMWSNSTGSYNSAIGSATLESNTTGIHNIALGHLSLGQLITGDFNTSIGSNSGHNSTGSGNIFLGYNSGFSELGSNKLYIENSLSATPLIYGEFDNDLLRINGELEVEGNIDIHNNSSILLSGANYKLYVDGNAITTFDLASGFEVNMNYNNSSGDPFSISGDGDLTDTNGHQSGFVMNREYNQTGTASGDAMFINTTWTSVGDGTTGIGNNAFRIDNDAETDFVVDKDGLVGIGTTTPSAKLDVNGGIRMANDVSIASAQNVGTLKYWSDANNSYIDMCMQTGALTYAWINIKTNTW